MRLHKQKVQNAECGSESNNQDVTQLVGVLDDESLTEKLDACEHFLVDNEMENGRNRFLIFAMDILHAHTLGQKLDTVFEKLKCAAKLNVAFRFVLRNLYDGFCRFHYAHENNILIKR